MKNRILNLYIIREIAGLFLLGITVFTLVLLMGRLIKLTDLVISRGVPLADVSRMILYLMPSFLVFTIPMAFLLAVLLAFGRLSADNEIMVMKAGGISLLQLMPPVMICAISAALITLVASTIGVPWGNSAFKNLSVSIVKQNVSATLREKVFWDDIPGLVVYCEQYDEKLQRLHGVLIHDGRDLARPMTIFATEGRIDNGTSGRGIALTLEKGSIHSAAKGGGYRQIRFGSYIMTTDDVQASGIKKSELDMTNDELLHLSEDPATPELLRRKLLSEYHSRFAFPFAALVFAVVAVPLGMQNRRSGKSAGFSTSIGILLAYYIIMSLLRSLADKGSLPPALAMWLPNIFFMITGSYLLRMVSLERSFHPWIVAKSLLRRWSTR